MLRIKPQTYLLALPQSASKDIKYRKLSKYEKDNEVIIDVPNHLYLSI